LISIGSPVSGDAAVAGGAGTVGVALWGPNPGTVVEAVGCAFVFEVVVVDDVAARVVVVVGFGRVVVVVDVDVVVVGAGFTVSTRSRSVPQALPATSRRATSAVLSGLR
jgi:hypothetical protein